MEGDLVKSDSSPVTSPTSLLPSFPNNGTALNFNRYLNDQMRMAVMVRQQLSNHIAMTSMLAGATQSTPFIPLLQPLIPQFTQTQLPVPNQPAIHPLTSSAQSLLCVGEQRRGRQTYTRFQTAALEKEFSQHTYLSRARRIMVSEMLNLSERQIKIWFQNRRMKHKRMKQHSKSDINEATTLNATESKDSQHSQSKKDSPPNETLETDVQFT